MKEILFVALSSLILLGCEKQKEEKQESYSFELKLSETYDPTWRELVDIIELAAMQGYLKLSINGTYIYLPPIQPYGKGTKEIPTTPETLTINGRRDYDEKDSYRSSVNRFELNELKDWLSTYDPEAIILSISENVSFGAVLSVVDLLNKEKVHLKLVRDGLADHGSMEFIGPPDQRVPE